MNLFSGDYTGRWSAWIQNEIDQYFSKAHDNEFFNVIYEATDVGVATDAG
jgi:phage anti-repressor protein